MKYCDSAFTYHSQVLRSINLDIGSNNSAVLPGQHRRRADGVIHRLPSAPHELLQLLVRLDIRTRDDFLSDDVFERLGADDLTSEFQAFHKDVHVDVVFEQVRVQGRETERVGSVNVNGAAGVRVGNGEEEGSVVLSGSRHGVADGKESDELSEPITRQYKV